MRAALHDLALSVGTTVGELVHTMGWGEFHGWMAYFDEHPREFAADRRAVAVMMSNGAKYREAKRMFPSLDDPAPLFKEPHKHIIVDGVDPAIAGGIAKLMAQAED